MSEIVEFVGPRGVGKSTVYKELFKRKSKKRSFSPAQDFLPIRSNIKAFSSDYIKFVIKFVYKRTLNKPFVDDAKIREASYKFLLQYRAFSNICWELITKNQNYDHNGADNRFRVASNLYQYFGIYQAIVDSVNPELCIRDELLLHTMVQLTNNEEVSKDDIFIFVQNVPLPKAVILFDAPSQVLAERSFNRKIIPSQRNKSFEDLIKSGEVERSKYLLLKEHLINFKIPILVIDSQVGVQDNVYKVIRFISKIEN